MFSTFFYVYLLITLVAYIIASWIYFQYKKAMVDDFRMKIFAVRDNLFDFAAAGNISFDNEAYKLMRTLLNGYLRSAEKIDISYFHVYKKAKKNGKLHPSCAFNNLYAQQTKSLSFKQKKVLDNCIDKLSQIAVLYMIKKSPLYCTYLIIKKVIHIKFKNYSFGALNKLKLEIGETINEWVNDIYMVGGMK